MLSRMQYPGSRLESQVSSHECWVCWHTQKKIFVFQVNSERVLLKENSTNRAGKLWFQFLWNAWKRILNYQTEMLTCKLSELKERCFLQYRNWETFIDPMFMFAIIDWNHLDRRSYWPLNKGGIQRFYINCIQLRGGNIVSIRIETNKTVYPWQKKSETEAGNFPFLLRSVNLLAMSIN